MPSCAMGISSDAPILSGMGRHVNSGGFAVRLVETFGRNLDRLMTDKRVQNKDLAAELSADVGTVSRWRNGKQPVDLLTVGRIADYLNVPAFLLLLDYPEEMALNMLKTLPPGLVPTVPGEYTSLIHMLVSGLSWATVEKWSVPGSSLPDNREAMPHKPVPRKAPEGRRASGEG